MVYEARRRNTIPSQPKVSRGIPAWNKSKATARRPNVPWIAHAAKISAYSLAAHATGGSGPLSYVGRLATTSQGQVERDFTAVGTKDISDGLVLFGHGTPAWTDQGLYNLDFQHHQLGRGLGRFLGVFRSVPSQTRAPRRFLMCFVRGHLHNGNTDASLAPRTRGILYDSRTTPPRCAAKLAVIDD